MWPFTKKQPNWHQIEIGMNAMVGLDVARPTKQKLRTRMARFGFAITFGQSTASIPKETIVSDIEDIKMGHQKLRNRIREALRSLGVPLIGDETTA